VHAHYGIRRVVPASGENPHLGLKVLGMRFFSPWGRT
jgi:hypothetical protein